MACDGKYMLVLWEMDNTVTVVARNCRSVIAINGNELQYSWPKHGSITGKILASSDSKRDMEKQSKVVTVTKPMVSEVLEDSSVSASRVSSLSSSTTESTKKRATNAKDKATIVKPAKKRRTIDKSQLEATSEAAKQIFKRQDDREIQKLQLELAAAREQNEALQKQLLKPQEAFQISDLSDVDSDSVVSDYVSLSDYDMPISDYEAAANIRREENRQLAVSMGISKENWELPARKSEKQKSDAALKQKPDTSSVNLTASPHLNKNPTKVTSRPHKTKRNEQREKIPVQKIELVKNMGIMIKSSSLAAINRKAKRQPTRILRYLMDELFSEEELKGSTVRGRKGKLPPLDEETMDAILCYAMGKAEEWGNPISEEALVRQGNDKCYQYRRKDQCGKEKQ